MKILAIILLLFLTGCSADLGVKNNILYKEFDIGGNKVIVGGQHQLGGIVDSTINFKPEVELNKWDNEVLLRIWSEEIGDDMATEVDDKIIWNTPDKEYNFYTLPPTTGMENGGFEYEIILKEKPKSNIIALKIETNNLIFLYQGELTEEEMINGVNRPENIIGSYAVYHSNKSGHIKGKTNYMAGKAFHIYRPKIEDAKGTNVWGILDIDIKKNLLTVTIPQTFLDKAVYPVKHATGLTLGYTTAGASSLTRATRVVGLYEYANSPASSGSVDSITVYASAASASFKGLIYDSNGDLYTNGVTPGTSLPTSAGWTTANYSTKPSFTSGVEANVSYIWSDTTTYYFDIGSGFLSYYDLSNNYSSPESVDLGENSSNILSIYATYTEDGGATTMPGDGLQISEF